MSNEQKMTPEELSDWLKMVEDETHLDLGSEYQDYLVEDAPGVAATIRAMVTESTQKDAQIADLQAKLEVARTALGEAAQSLEAIRSFAGTDPNLKEMSQIRGYANSRAVVARAALNADPALLRERELEKAKWQEFITQVDDVDIQLVEKDLVMRGNNLLRNGVNSTGNLLLAAAKVIRAVDALLQHQAAQQKGDVDGN